MKKYSILILLLAASVLLALFCGNQAVGTMDIFRVLAGGGTDAQKTILWRIRIPRIQAAMLAGAALSVSGYLLQNDLNNALGSPGLLGINHGAGLFVLLSAVFFPYRYDMKCLMAFMGALLVTAAVYFLSAATGMSKTSVILSGVAVSAVCTSVSDLMISLRPEVVADRAAFQLGGFAAVPLASVGIAAPVMAAGLLGAVLTAPALDLMALGDELAGALGLSVRIFRGLHILFAALLAGAAVSLGGLISFVGLMVPNLVRLIYRGKHRGGVILCALAGAAFLLACDTLARLLVFPYELPCGLLLNCTGAPFLIWVLVKKRKRLGIQ